MPEHAFDFVVSRATGALSLVLLSAVMILGMLTAGKALPSRLPAMVKVSLHRNISLLLVLFVALHTVTAITAAHGLISWWDAIVPFAGDTLHLGRTAAGLSIDILLAVMLTGVLRHRVPTPMWQAVHLLSYLMFPLAVTHTIMLAKSDSGWMLPLTTSCVTLVLAVAVWRGHDAWQHRAAHIQVRNAFKPPSAAVSAAAPLPSRESVSS